MTEQLYLIKISAMCTSDDCDCVPSAEFIVDRDLSTKTHTVIDQLHKLISELTNTLMSTPLENIRPMNRDEIQEWRDDMNDASGIETIRLA